MELRRFRLRITSSSTSTVVGTASPPALINTFMSLRVTDQAAYWAVRTPGNGPGPGGGSAGDRTILYRLRHDETTASPVFDLPNVALVSTDDDFVYFLGRTEWPGFWRYDIATYGGLEAYAGQLYSIQLLLGGSSQAARVHRLPLAGGDVCEILLDAAYDSDNSIEFSVRFSLRDGFMYYRQDLIRIVRVPR